MAEVEQTEREPNSEALSVARDRARSRFRKAVADIVREKRFKTARDNSDLDMQEAATELTNRK